MENILKDYLLNQVKLNSPINWDYGSTLKNQKDMSDENNTLLNYLAFSFLDKKEKNKLYLLIIENNIHNIKDELFSFFTNYYKKLSNNYPIKDIFLKDFAHHFFDWLEIINKEIDTNVIDKILKSVHFKDNSTWLYLIKELHSRKLFEENYRLIDIKKEKIKGTLYYEDFSIYQIFSILGMPDYMESKRKIKELSKLVKNINSYPVNKIFVELECALLTNNIPKFDSVISKNLNLLEDFSVLELLYIYEFSVLLKAHYSIEIINKYLYRRDINSYKDTLELYIYEYYNLLSKGTEESYRESLKYIKKLHMNGYNFKHILWYFKSIPQGNLFYNIIIDIIK